MFCGKFIRNKDRVDQEVGSNGCLTSIGLRRSNINLLIWAPKQYGSQPLRCGHPPGTMPASFNAAFHGRFRKIHDQLWARSRLPRIEAEMEKQSVLAAVSRHNCQCRHLCLHHNRGVMSSTLESEAMLSMADSKRRTIDLSNGLGRNALVFDEDDVVHLLRAAVEREGSQIAFADRYGVDRAYISTVLNGRRRVSGSLAKALGLRRVYVVE
jgi:hypothetical protein